MTDRRRLGPILLTGFSLAFVALSALGWWQRTFDASRVPAIAIAGDTLHGGAACLPRDRVLAGLAQRGIRTTAEPPPFCVTPPGLTDWVALTPATVEGTHLAFDAAGCLVTWAPCTAR